MRLINEEEKNELLNSKVKSTFSLGILLYIMGVLLPFLVCMLLTRFYAYLYIFAIGLIILYFMMVIYPALFKRNIRENEISCFDSKIVEVKDHSIYYYTASILDINGNVINYHFPVSRKLRKGSNITVCMLAGSNHYSRYYLLDGKGKILTCKRTRFDLID